MSITAADCRQLTGKKVNSYHLFAKDFFTFMPDESDHSTCYSCKCFWFVFCDNFFIFLSAVNISYRPDRAQYSLHMGYCILKYPYPPVEDFLFVAFSPCPWIYSPSWSIWKQQFVHTKPIMGDSKIKICLGQNIKGPCGKLQGRGWGRWLNNVLHREAPLRGPTPYPFMYHF